MPAPKTPLEQLLEDLNVERHTPAPPRPGSQRALAREEFGPPMSADALGKFLDEIDDEWADSTTPARRPRGGQLRVINPDVAVGE